MTTIIHAQEAIEALRALVQKTGPDFVYYAPGDDCVYVVLNDEKDYEPSCAVGKVLVNTFKVDVTWLHKFEENNANRLDALFVQYGNSPVRITAAASQVLQAFQSNQDCAESYGHALKKAEEAFLYVQDNPTYPDVI